MEKENKEETNQISEELNGKKPEYNELIINGYKYKYKVTNKIGFCFRCINRTICKLTILILFEEFIKIKNTEINNNEIKITINSKQQTHTCSKKTVLIANNDNIKTKKEES